MHGRSKGCILLHTNSPRLHTFTRTRCCSTEVYPSDWRQSHDRTTNVSDQVSSEITEDLSENGCPSRIMRRGDKLEDPRTGPMERETIRMSVNPDLTIETDALKTGSLSNHGRTMESEKELHQCTRNEISSICSSRHGKGKQRY